MVQALKQRVRIGANGRVEIGRSELPEGRLADVIVVLDDQPSALTESEPLRPLSSFLGVCKGQFRSAEEADAYVRALRDEWDERTPGLSRRQRIHLCDQFVSAVCTGARRAVHGGRCGPDPTGH